VSPIAIQREQTNTAPITIKTFAGTFFKRGPRENDAISAPRAEKLIYAATEVADVSNAAII
jgi:hypothetical protein